MDNSDSIWLLMIIDCMHITSSLTIISKPGLLFDVADIVYLAFLFVFHLKGTLVIYCSSCLFDMGKVYGCRVLPLLQTFFFFFFSFFGCLPRRCTWIVPFYFYFYLWQLYCPNRISPIGNSGCLPRGKPATTESRYPTYGACWVF